ncbi:TauD/TfdA family dioxygenase [Streptomyces sp. NPDC002577]
MKPILREFVTDSTAWKGEDLKNDQSWIYQLDDADLAEIDQALAGVEARGLAAGDFTAADFPLPRVEKKLAEVDEQIRGGRGFCLIRGVPVKKYTLDQVKTLYWGLGCYLGTVISQNDAGDFVGPVVDQGLKDDDPNRRNNTTNRPLDPHTDLADVVSLICIEKAREGGQSTLASAVAVHNEIVKNHPEYLQPLYEGFYHDYRGYGPNRDPNEVTPAPIPVFEYHNGRVSCAFAKEIIHRGAAKRGVPLTPLQEKAVQYVHDLALREDMRIDMMLEPGDIQLINNYITLHSRSNYIDHQDGRKRYLLRMWINLPNSVQLSPEFAGLVRRGIPAKPTEKAA